MDAVEPLSSEFKWEFSANGSYSTPKRFVASQEAAWVLSAALTGPRTVKLLCTVSGLYPCCTVAILADTVQANPAPGTGTSTGHPFFYLCNSGVVNGADGFAKASYGQHHVDLVIDSANSVSFSVDGAKQTGSWPIPKSYRVLVDTYWPSSSVEFVKKK